MIQGGIKSIKRISVKRLFGLYDYDLELSIQTNVSEKIFILYGDNGSGKTTLLKLAFHALAPDEKAGHKSAIARVQFDHFEVELHDGTRIWAKRSKGKTIGSFFMGIKAPRKADQIVEFIADENNAVNMTSDKNQEQINAFLNTLSELNIYLYLLSDDRTIQLAGKRRDQPYPYDIELEEHVTFSDQEYRTRIRRGQINPELLAQKLLSQSITRAEFLIRGKAIQGSSKGESNVNALYNEILHRLVSLKQDESIDTTTTKKSIERRISSLEKQSLAYAKYGIMPKFSGIEISNAVVAAQSTQIGIITNVLNPYLESLERKLDALKEIHTRVDSFITIVNRFLSDKEIVFDLQNGFAIKSGERLLTPAMLSSGERHLLLLFCTSLVAADHSSILMIDEPEISLNIKWQRQLISALLDCIGDNHVQYVFSTHSLEILSQHRESVCKLENKNSTRSL